jgi:hypothetical protein
MKTIVDRKKWLRGPYLLHINSCLLNTDVNMMCCLGFRAKTLGLTDEEIEGVAEPCYLDKVDSRLEVDSWLLKTLAGQDTRYSQNYISSADACKAMETNDSLELTDEEREKIITEIFNRNDEEIEFVGPRLPIVNGKEVKYEEVDSHGRI